MKKLTRISMLAAAAMILTSALNSAQAGCHSKPQPHYSSHHHSHYRPAYAPIVHHQHVHQPRIVAPPVVRTPVPNGATITITGQFHGQFTQIFMSAQHQQLPVQVIRSTPAGLTIQLPALHIHGPTEASVYLALPCGTLIDRTPLLLTPVAPELHQ